MPRTKEQNEAIRAEKRRLIMDSALLLFAENGFEQTSIDSIAQHAEVSKGLIYNYFKCKDDLLYQILISGMKAISENLHPEMTMESFVADSEKFFDYILENKEFFKLYTIISVQPKVTQKLGIIRNESENLRHNMADLFKKHFGEEQAMQEMLLYAVISKGFSIISVFEDEQNPIFADILKKTVVDFMKERYKM
jgi:AcrR family transcriptional regulator